MFSQIKDIYIYIEQDLYSVLWIMPQDGTWGGGVLGNKKFNLSEHGHVTFQIERSNIIKFLRE